MSFFQFNDKKSQRQIARAIVDANDTRRENARNVALFYEKWGRIAELRLTDEVGEVRTVQA